VYPGSIAMPTPQTFNMASGPAHFTSRGDVSAYLSGNEHCTRPRSARFEPVEVLRGFGHWFLSYGYSSRLPGPYRQYRYVPSL
jgi:hypothetical protein